MFELLPASLVVVLKVILKLVVSYTIGFDADNNKVFIMFVWYYCYWIT